MGHRARVAGSGRRQFLHQGARPSRLYERRAGREPGWDAGGGQLISTACSRATQFNSGETYAEWKPGDKVAEYGLAGLIVGGAAAAAVKTGLFKGLWKILLVGGAAILAGARKLFGGKKSDA